MSKSASNCILLLSGGVDSFACGHFLKNKNLRVESIFVDYGQRAAKCEYSAAQKISSYLGFPLQRISLDLNGQFESGEIRGRNPLLIFSALTASKISDGLIALGIHGGTPYFDCSETFVTEINKLVEGLSSDRIRVLAPFLSWTKIDIFGYFESQALPFEITYSCEYGDQKPCGGCLSCKDRKKYELSL